MYVQLIIVCPWGSRFQGSLPKSCLGEKFPKQPAGSTIFPLPPSLLSVSLLLSLNLP